MSLGPLTFPRRSRIRIPDADPIVFSAAAVRVRRADLIEIEWPAPLAFPRRRPIAVPQLDPDYPEE